MSFHSSPFLFFHGGPGLSCEAERQILKPVLDQHHILAEFFDEPSRSRPQGPAPDLNAGASALLRAAEEFLDRQTAPAHLVGLSFGAMIVEHLLAKSPSKVKSLILVCPCFDQYAALKMMFALAQADYEKIDQDKAKGLKELISETQTFYDEACENALGLTLQDPLFFQHYWQNPEMMMRWATTLDIPGYQFDPTSQGSIYQELKTKNPFLSVNSADLPVRVIYADHDPVKSRELSLAVLRAKYSRMTEQVFPNSGHFPHLEHPEAFSSILIGI